MYYKFISEREDCTSLWLLNGLLTETGLKVWEEEPELLSNVASLQPLPFLYFLQN